MDAIVTRRYTFKLYPTPRQAAALNDQLRLHAALWNGALQERMDCYRLTGKSLSYYDQAKHLKTIRADDPAYAALSSGSLERTLKNLDLAFQAFFRRVKAGAGASSGFPRFKAAARHDCLPFRDGSGWSMRPSASGWRIYLKGIVGLIRARGRFPAAIDEFRTMEVLRRDGGWWLSVVVRMQPRRRAGATALTIRLDLIDQFAEVKSADGGCTSVAFCHPESENSLDTTIGLSGTPCGNLADAGEMVEEHMDAHVSATCGNLADAGEMVGSLMADEACSNPVVAGEMQAQLVFGKAAETCRNHVAAGEMQVGTYGRADARAGGITIDTLKSLRDTGPKRYSRRWYRLSARIRRMERQMARQRAHDLHVWSSAMIACACAIEIIAPEIATLTAAGRGDRRVWGAAVQTIAAVNRHILGQAPASAIAMLAYKAAEAGISFTHTIDRAPKAAIGHEIGQSVRTTRKARAKLKETTA
jgi:transposase